MEILDQAPDLVTYGIQHGLIRRSAIDPLARGDAQRIAARGKRMKPLKKPSGGKS